MNPKLSIAVITLALISGALGIFLSNRLMRKYPLPYLSSYFYYLIFTCIFGAYSIVGSRVIHFLLSDHRTDAETVQSAAVFLLILGIPFLILGWYMFIRLILEFFQKQIKRVYAIIYFAVFLLLFAGYTLFSVYGGTIGTFSFQPDMKEVIYIFSFLHALITGSGILYLFFRASHFTDIYKRKTCRWFAGWYGIILFLNILTLNISPYNHYFGLIFIFGFLGFHLIPILFVHNYLNHYYINHVESSSFDEKLNSIIKNYGISKRECDVFILVCKGMTNQEISDSLYISLQTVKDHIYRIFLKTGVKNRVQLTNLLGQ